MLRRLAFAASVLSLSCVPSEGTPASSSVPSLSPASAAATGEAASVTTKSPAPPREAQKLTVDADGHPITVWFKSHAEPRDVIVLVHGRTWSGRPDFDLQSPGESRSLMDSLVQEGFAVYAVDQRGYGGTPRDDTGWLTPDRAQKDLALVLAEVGRRHTKLAPPSLLGWSLGSLVAQLTAQRDPALVSTVTLYGYPRDPARVYTADAAGKPARAKTTAKAAAEDFIVKGAISQAGSNAFAAAAVAADPIRADWRGSEQWNALKPEDVSVPTLLIHGESDPYAPKHNQAALFQRLGHADRQWVILPGCDHAAHLERCGPRFVHAVTEFVRRPSAN